MASNTLSSAASLRVVACKASVVWITLIKDIVKDVVGDVVCIRH